METFARHDPVLGLISQSSSLAGSHRLDTGDEDVSQDDLHTSDIFFVFLHDFFFISQSSTTAGSHRLDTGGEEDVN